MTITEVENEVDEIGYVEAELALNQAEKFYQETLVLLKEVEENGSIVARAKAKEMCCTAQRLLTKAFKHFNQAENGSDRQYAHRVGPWTPSSEYLTDMTGDNLIELNMLAVFYGFLDMTTYERAEMKLADFI